METTLVCAADCWHDDDSHGVAEVLERRRSFGGVLAHPFDALDSVVTQRRIPYILSRSTRQRKRARQPTLPFNRVTILSRAFPRKCEGLDMRAGISTATALVAAMAFAPLAHAEQFSFGFNGLGFSGNGVFSAVPDISPADPNPNCGTAGNNACRSDPRGVLMITGISGTFSDTTSGIVNGAITGLVPIHPQDERDGAFDPKVPSSLSFIDYGAPPNAGALSYNNLFFPDGSPIDCTDFPFTGTFLDSFGMAFTVAGGYTINLWGDGDNFGPNTTTYGVGVTDGDSKLAYAFGGVNATVAAVPEPSTYALFGVGLFGLIAWRKRSKGDAWPERTAIA